MHCTCRNAESQPEGEAGGADTVSWIPSLAAAVRPPSAVASKGSAVPYAVVTAGQFVCMPLENMVAISAEDLPAAAAPHVASKSNLLAGTVDGLAAAPNRDGRGDGSGVC